MNNHGSTATSDYLGVSVNASGDHGSQAAKDSTNAASKGSMLIADNAKTVALGSGGVALASGLPLGLGWFIRRRLGLDASDILDRKLGLK